MSKLYLVMLAYEPEKAFEAVDGQLKVKWADKETVKVLFAYTNYLDALEHAKDPDKILELEFVV